MKQWSLTLFGPSGLLSSFESGEAQFVVGSEESAEVWGVQGESIAPRHAWLWLAEARMQVEDLAGGTLVNGHPIEGRVEVEYPASVQVGDVTLVVEVKGAAAAEVVAAQEGAADPSLAVTIPQRAARQSTSSLDVTIPQRALREAQKQRTEPRAAAPGAQNRAPLSGEYTLVREIARGGMGQIYFGEDPQLEREVAVKVSSVAYGGEDPRFFKEAKVLAHLAHPNIVPIYNIGVDAQSRPFYAMKLVKGRTLQAVLNALREGDPPAVNEYPRAALLTVFRKVCDAMAFAHSKGVLHRDLKPENIMVGEYGEVLVMDWGLAKVLGGEETGGGAKAPAKDTGDYGMTLEGEVMGTPQYMSPEQAEGMVADLDARSDIYALGGILYAILTLRPPIDGTTLNEVLTKVKKGEISAMTTRRGSKGDVKVGTPAAMGGEVPEALQAVTLKAMARERAKRYASVEALACDIEAYQNGFATSAEQAGAVRQLVLFIKRNKGVSAAVALFLLAAAAFTVKLAASERIARINERRAVAASEKSRREEAQTSLMLAETCLETGDVGGMESALLAIPEDLRTPTWRYLENKIDQCDREFISTDTNVWVGIENHPTDPNLFVALQSNGEFCSLDPRTGERTVLWKAGGAALKLAVSADGTRTAVAFRKGKTLEIAVFDFASGEKKGVSIQPRDSLEIFELQVSPQYVLLRFSPEGPETARCLCWDFQTGEQLWEKPYYVAPRFTNSGTEVFGRDLIHNFVRLEARTGRELESSRRLPSYPESGFPNSFSWGAKDMVLGKTAGKIVKAVIGGDSPQFSLPGGDKVSALAQIPEHTRFAAVVKTGPNSLQLELRDLVFGDLLKAFPMRGRLLLSGDSVTTVRGNSGFIAVTLMDSRPRIRMFDLRKTQPLHGGNISKERAQAIWTEDGNGILVLSKTKTEAEKKSSYLIEKVDYGATRGGAVRTPLLKVHDKGGYEIYLAGRRANDWIVYGRDGRISGASLGPGEPREHWAILDTGMSNFAIHPTRDELFFGSKLLDLKTGREIRPIDKQGWKMRDDRELNRPQSLNAVWVGEDRVLEPVEPRNQSVEKSEAKQTPMLALWNVRTGGPDVIVDAPYASVLAVSPDGTRVLEGGVDKRVRIRNGATLAVESESRVHDQPVSGVAWHPTKPLVASASSDGTLRIWNRNDWSLVEEFRTGDTKTWDVQISPSGKRLLAMKLGSGIRVYEPKSFQD